MMEKFFTVGYISLFREPADKHSIYSQLSIEEEFMAEAEQRTRQTIKVRQVTDYQASWTEIERGTSGAEEGVNLDIICHLSWLINDLALASSGEGQENPPFLVSLATIRIKAQNLRILGIKHC
jgi:hypothetical protein